MLATAGDDKIVALWDAGTGQPTGPERLVGATGALLDVDISGDGGGDMCVLGAGTDRAVRLWDAATGLVRHTMTGHADKVCAARFCPWETNRAVSCSHDRTIKVWDLAKGYAVASIMCAVPLYRSRIEQSRPEKPLWHVQRLCRQSPWPEQPLSHPSVPSASISQPSPLKPM